MEFKDKLKKLRAEKKISQQALADAIFISRSAVAKWENGLGLPSEDSMTALCNYFGVTKDHFITEQAENIIVDKNKKIRRLRQWFIIAVALIVMYAAIFIYYAVSAYTGGNENEVYGKLYYLNAGDPEDIGSLCIQIHESGTYFYNKGLSCVGFGHWSEDDGVLTLTGTERSITKGGYYIYGDEMILTYGDDPDETYHAIIKDGTIYVNGYAVSPDEITNRFRFDGENLYYIADGSDNFINIRLGDGDVFFSSGDRVIH